MKLSPYPEYKDSDVPWLGRIPAHWSIKPGLAFISQRKEKNVGMKESIVLSLSYGKIVVKPPTKLHGLVPESFETYQITEPGNIIVRGTDLQNDKTSLRIGKVRNRGIITSAYLCLQANNKISSDYVYLLLHGYDLMKIYYGMGSGLRQSLGFSDFKRLPVLVPSDSEQNKIHGYLEFTHAQINKFIRNKLRLIALLKEQKQTIINEAVTQGINPDVEMKDSGLEWLGEIPAHWEVRKLKHIAAMKSGDNLTSMEIEEQDKFPVYGGNGLRGFYNSFNHSGGFLLVGRQGALCGNVHRVRGEFWATEHAVVTTLKKGICLDWYYYMLVFMDLNQYSEAAAQPGISVEKIQNLRTTVPPISEQEQIAGYIDTETALIDKTITRAEREIELIREYRTRLISDVVTGQVDVRDVEVPEVAEDALLAFEAEITEDDLPEDDVEQDDEGSEG